MVFVISELVRKIREELSRQCGKEVPFVTVCHDIWNGKKRDILGISVMFIDPRNCMLYRIPIGMIRISGHTAQQVSDLTWILMSGIGFHQSDLLKSVNDNTLAAVLASKYITGLEEGGKCDMHKADLVIKHATGLCKRYLDGSPVDENPDFMELYDKFLNFARWFMSKKKRSRYDNFAAWCHKNGKVCIEIPLPNKTRVSGCVIIMQALLRLKWLMQAYANQAFGGCAEFKRMFPTEADWEILSLFEAILSPLQKCSMALQTDDCGISAVSLLEIHLCRKQIDNMILPLLSEAEARAEGAVQGGLLILSTRRTDYDEAENTIPWDGSITSHKLEKRRRAVAFEAIHKKGQNLVERIATEFDNYFKQEHRPESELAIIASPILAYITPYHLVDLGVFEAADIERVRDLYVEEMVKCFSTHAGAPTTGTRATANRNADDDDDSDASSDDGDAGMSPARKRRNDGFAGFVHRMKLQETAQAMYGGRAGPDDPFAVLESECENELKLYLEYCRLQSGDMAKWITAYPTEKYTTDSKGWGK
jgi:hypothetical protein